MLGRISRAALLLLAGACILHAAVAQPQAGGALAPAPSHEDHDGSHLEGAAAQPTSKPQTGGNRAAADALAPAQEHAHEEEEHAHEEAAAGGPAAAADADHAHSTAGDAHDHGSGHEGHSHGVSILEFAAVAAELGSVDAAKAEVCAQEAEEDYSLGLHIGSVFILLVVSLAGALLPVALHISSKSSAVLAAVKMGTYFGFGTILSTAFIHMLLPAAQNLSSPCLPESWLDAYEAWAYLFVVIAIVAMQLVDFLIEGAYQKYIQRRGGQPHGAACHEQAHDHDKHTHHAAVVGALVTVHGSQASLAPPQPKPQPDVEAGLSAAESSEVSEEGGTCTVHGDGCNTLIPHKHDTSQIVGIYLMETGIIFHSVLIGITLGVTGGGAFSTLLVALSFHQFFEGFAIGSAAVDSGMSALRSAVMGLAYSITTPIGIAIGIGMRESFNQNSTTTLLVEGVFDSVSTGILIYVVLVELINPMLTQSAWLRSRRWWVQALAFAAFWSGVAVMAVIGRWV